MLRTYICHVTQVARSPERVVNYPVVETVQQDNICHLVMAPAQVSQEAAEAACQLANRAIGTMPGCGIYGVELFLLPDGSVVLNEIAPRPHNSGIGHY